MVAVPSPTATNPAPRAEDLAVIRAPSRRRRWLIGGGIAALALIGGALGLAFRGGDGPQYETTPLTRGTLTERVTAVGTQPCRIIRPRLRPSPRMQSLRAFMPHCLPSAKASAAEAAVNVKKARLVSDRATALLAQGAATVSDQQDAALSLESAEAALRVAGAQLSQSMTSLADAQQDLAKTVIASPMDGVVIHRLVDPGQTVVSAMSATPMIAWSATAPSCTWTTPRARSGRA